MKERAGEIDNMDRRDSPALERVGTPLAEAETMLAGKRARRRADMVGTMKTRWSLLAEWKQVLKLISPGPIVTVTSCHVDQRIGLSLRRNLMQDRLERIY